MKPHTIKYAGIMSVMLIAANAANAETVTEYIAKQQELNTLDHTAAKLERLVEIKEKQHELDTVGRPQPQQNAQSQQGQGMQQMGSRFFKPAYTSGDDAAIESQSKARDELSEEAKRRKDKEQEKLAELAIMQDAEIIEVFRDSGKTSTYGAVVEIDGGKREIRPGDTISNWKITQITLNEITAKNEKYDGVVRRIKQIR